VFLASEDAPSGAILTAAAGVFAAARIEETEGVHLGQKASADDVAANWAKIADFSTAKYFSQGSEQFQKLFARLQDPPVVG
jgi:hypothetical protein